jgi:hypothetical protein
VLRWVIRRTDLFTDAVFRQLLDCGFPLLQPGQRKNPGVSVNDGCTKLAQPDAVIKVFAQRLKRHQNADRRQRQQSYVQQPPTLAALSGSVVAPTVTLKQSGLEHSPPTRSFNSRLVFAVKSFRLS